VAATDQIVPQTRKKKTKQREGCHREPIGGNQTTVESRGGERGSMVSKGNQKKFVDGCRGASTGAPQKRIWQVKK